MSGLLLVVRAESYRLLHARSTWIGMLFLALVSALRVLAARVADAASRAEALAAGRSLGDDGGGEGWSPLVEGWRAGLAVASLLLLIQAAGTLAADRERGVLRVGLTRSSSRSAIVVGRALLAPVLVLGAFAVTGLAAWGVTAAFYDFGALIEDGYELMSAKELRHELWLSALAILPPLVATYAFGLCVSAFGRTAAGAVGVSLSVFLAFDLFKEVLGAGRYWIFASFAPSLVDGSAMQEMAGVAHGYADAGLADALLRMSLIIPLPEALLLVLVACWGVHRRPV